jgi:hypothetical protein
LFFYIVAKRALGALPETGGKIKKIQGEKAELLAASRGYAARHIAMKTVNQFCDAAGYLHTHPSGCAKTKLAGEKIIRNLAC